MPRLSYKNYKAIGEKIYDRRKWKENRRYWIFLLRSLFHSEKMKRIDDFFQSTPLLHTIAETYPFVYEQPQRAFFYAGSTFEDRIKLVQDHFSFLQKKLRADVCEKLYRQEKICLWKHDELFQNEELTISLFFEPGQRKEGLLSLCLFLGERPLYQMIFWIAQNILWIGAMQGPRGEDGRDLIKLLTKFCHAYRTKNLILYATQAVTRALGLEKIFAVTNAGYYANNHQRIDRKLKTDFGTFWQEAGGKTSDDKRFDELPLVEPRKTMEEVPTRKRAVYRKRFALLDDLDEKISQAMQKILK